MRSYTNRVLVAVLDTGFDILHPDLVLVYKGSDNTAGYNIATNPEHGTEVAGVLGALGDNVYGIAGVDKSWTSLAAIKVFSDVPYVAASDADIIAAIDIAAAEGAKVVNMSFGGPKDDPQLCRAIANSPQILFVAAAGNISQTGNVRNYPAACGTPGSLPNLISVGASDQSDGIWSDSVTAGVDVYAPGASILTTEPGSIFTIVSGTSYAAPQVAGVAGMMFAKDPYPGTTPAFVKSKILSRASRMPDGHLQLNACGALDGVGC
jgi:subtilisin family serine protease